VHKKPQVKTVTSLPTTAPAAVTETPHERLKQDAINALVATAENQPDWGQRDIDAISEECWEVMDEYSPETLRNLTNVAKTDMGFMTLKMIGYRKEQEAFLNDWVMLDRAVRDEDLMVKPDTMIRGLGHYENIAPASDPERRTEQGLAICRAISHMSFHRLGGVAEDRDVIDDKRFFYLEDKALRTLITTHHDPGAVAGLIVERNIIDGEQLAQLVINMDRTHAALGEGAL
jgi:hypothetical protein